MQHFILRYLPRPSRRGHHHCSSYRTLHDAAAAAASSVVTSINWVRDRALDHAVEKERDLKTMLNVKNLINSESSKSLPLSIISDKKDSLGIRIRPIDFIRKYPSVFEEFLPGGIGIHPHVKLTPEILTLDAEEQLLFQSEIQKQDVADRLLKLLMIARINKIPLCVINRFKWDLGLPHDYTQTLVPQFPDYFKVTSSGNELELVCWSDELAVSVMEKRSMSSFPLQYSRGFELDKKFKKWVDDWQKLPYVSPYENALHLQAKSDESDKWAVALLHELLHLLVPRKTEKDNLLFLGEYLGVRSRFKRALLQLPGIFYVSSKLGTHTVVLREAYKRDLLVSKPQHPLMTLRSKHIHLMNAVKNESKSKNADVDVARKQKATQRSNQENEEDKESDDAESEQEEDETVSSLSGSEFEGVTDSDSINDDKLVNGRIPTWKTKFEGQDRLKHARNRSVGRGRGRGRGGINRNTMFDDKIDLGINQMSDRRKSKRETNPPRFLRTEAVGARKAHGKSSQRSSVSRTREGRC